MLIRLTKASRDNEEAFTLIELLVVIIIIGILAAIAIPVFLNQRQKGVDASLKSDLRAMATAQETYLTDNPNAVGYAVPATTGAVNVGTIGFRPSAGNSVRVTVKAGTGYCITAANPSATRSTGFMYYDSATGGLSSVNSGWAAPTGGACN